MDAARGTGGRLVVFEGPEGAGKTTQVQRVATWLRAGGQPVRVLREPGATPLGDDVRRLLLDSAHDIAPRAEALLFMAARAQLVEQVLRPALAAGETVLVDRFFLSTYAYQAAGHGLPLDGVRAANALATQEVVPDLTLLLALPADEGLARAGRRGGADRIERLGSPFHRRVAEAFRGFAEPAWQAAHPEVGPIVLVDASGDEDRTFQAVTAALAARWPALAPAPRPA